MAIRSVKITLANNTRSATNFGVTLSQFAASLCHGSWTSGLSAPATIAPNDVVTWQSEDKDGSLFTGTEGWIKYTAAGSNVYVDANDANLTVSELIYIHWDNPYAWDSNTNPFDFKPTLSDVPPPCDDSPVWGVGGSGVTPSAVLATELFLVSNNASGPPSFDFGSSGAGPTWDVIVDWPGLLVAGLIDAEHDVNLEFTLGFAVKKRIHGRIRHFYDGSKGLRALAVQARQPSLKKLFAL